MNKSIFKILPLLAISALVSALFIGAPAANAATLTCADWAPDSNSVLLCNLGLKAKPTSTTPPATTLPATTPAKVCTPWTTLFGCKEPVTPPVVTPPVTPPTADPYIDSEGCGTQLTTKKPDGTDWTCSFSDNFSANTLDRNKWVPQTNFSSGNANYYSCYADDPNVISQSDGTLKLSVKKLATKVKCPSGLADTYYGSGQISTFYKFSQKHGRFEARVKSPVIDKTSLQEAFWLWPDVSTESIYPVTGEIDVSEMYSEYPNLAVPYLHYDGTSPTAYNGSNSAKANTSYSCLANRGEWNTYAVEWDANHLEIFVNGKSCLLNTSKNAQLNKKYIVAMTAALGVPANSYADIDRGPQTTEVDYIRAWK